MIIKKGKGTKNCDIKKKLKFEHYKYCLETTQLKNKISYLKKKLKQTALKKFINDAEETINQH